MEEFYKRMAAQWYVKREQYRYEGDYKKYAHAERELMNYLKAAGLPEDWQPETEIEND